MTTSELFRIKKKCGKRSHDPGNLHEIKSRGWEKWRCKFVVHEFPLKLVPYKFHIPTVYKMRQFNSTMDFKSLFSFTSHLELGDLVNCTLFRYVFGIHCWNLQDISYAIIGLSALSKQSYFDFRWVIFHRQSSDRKCSIHPHPKKKHLNIYIYHFINIKTHIQTYRLFFTFCFESVMQTI